MSVVAPDRVPDFNPDRHPTHRLVIEDRRVIDAKPHRHPYRARCACGWAAIPTRRRREAQLRYRQHVAAFEGYTQRGRVAEAGKRELTPRDELPDALC